MQNYVILTSSLKPVEAIQQLKPLSSIGHPILKWQPSTCPRTMPHVAMVTGYRVPAPDITSHTTVCIDHVIPDHVTHMCVQLSV